MVSTECILVQTKTQERVREYETTRSSDEQEAVWFSLEMSLFTCMLGLVLVSRGWAC